MPRTLESMVKLQTGKNPFLPPFKLEQLTLFKAKLSILPIDLFYYRTASAGKGWGFSKLGEAAERVLLRNEGKGIQKLQQTGNLLLPS